MWIGIVVAVIAVGIGIALGVSQAKKDKALVDAGKTVVRDYRYAQRGEEFTAKIGSYKALADKLSKMERPCAIEGNAATQVRFTGKTYAARLCRVDFDAPSGIGVFRFEFTRWKEYNGRYEEYNAMNMLMTSVEKCFRELDPNVGTSTYAIDFKRKYSLV